MTEPGQRPACGEVSAILVPACGAWWGVYSYRWQTPVESVTALEDKVDRQFDVVMRYHDFSSGPNGTFPDSAERELGQSRMLFLQWESRVYDDGRIFTWSDIAQGRYDEEILRPAARRVARYGDKVFMSFDHEMDRREGHGDPGDYVAAARHVHDVFEEEGARNVVWVWVITGFLDDGRAELSKRLYPGDAYVDWIGYDPYNFYKCTGTRWETFEGAIAPAYTWLQRSGFGDKPFILAEYGTQYDPENPQRSRDWYRSIPPTLRKYPNIKGLLRWDSGEDCGLRIENGPGMLEAFRTAGLDPYVHGQRR